MRELKCHNCGKFYEVDDYLYEWHVYNGCDFECEACFTGDDDQQFTVSPLI